jgi:hypothetical protein
VSGIGFTSATGNADGRPSGFNDLGQISFVAFFTDGTSGVFVSRAVAVPEPSTLVAACVALGYAMGFLRRWR